MKSLSTTCPCNHFFTYATSLKIVFLALLVASCGGDDNEPTPTPNPDASTFTVTFRAQDGQEVTSQSVEKSEKVDRPQDPIRPGYIFRGWFTDPSFQSAFDFTVPISGNIVLYALWEKIPYKFWVPDHNFRDALKALIPHAFDVSDSLITQHAEVKGLAVLDIASLSIADLAGIEYFTALTQLYVSDNDLTMLDVSHNTFLTHLACSFNQLTVLDLSQNALLSALECTHNQLSVLDVSQNASLEHLLCQHNRLTMLDLSRNASLRILECGHNQLKILDVLHNALLNGLSCHNNQLTVLDLSQNVSLIWLLCHDNELIELDMRGVRLVENDDLLQINVASSSNPLRRLKVHENVKDQNESRESKIQRGSEVIISTYSALDDSTDYKLECADYDPISRTCLSNDSKSDFTVAFDLNGGMGAIDSLKVEEGERAVRPDPDPTRDGYTFSGWFTDRGTLQNAFDFSAVVTNDTTLYAGWEAVSYKVSFDLNGGKGSIDPLTLEEGERAVKPDPDPTRDGYTFSGWFTDKGTLQSAFDFSAVITSDTTLYAGWEAVSYKVSFDLNGGMGSIDPLKVEAGERTVRPDPDPTRDSYDFLGWYSDVSLSNAFRFATPVNDDMILYAKWGPESLEGLFYIPDDNFRNKLKALLGPDVFDNRDRLRTQHDAVTGLASLDVEASGIADLTGIEFFTALTNLDCRTNGLASLDVSKNTALRFLDCRRNPELTSLNLSQNTALIGLLCANDGLKTLDIRGMRSVFNLGIGAFNSENLLEKLLVHENLQDHAEIKEAKTNRGDALVIETYSAEAGSTDYTAVCLDYNPNDGSCKKAAP